MMNLKIRCWKLSRLWKNKIETRLGNNKKPLIHLWIRGKKTFKMSRISQGIID